MGPSLNLKSNRAHSARSVKYIKGRPKSRPGTATEALQELRGVAHEADLRRIHSKLEGVLSAVIVVQHALMENNCEIDDDAADVLRISSDELDRQIEQIEILLGELPRDERGEDDGGEA